MLNFLVCVFNTVLCISSDTHVYSKITCAGLSSVHPSHCKDAICFSGVFCKKLLTKRRVKIEECELQSFGLLQ
jgi:hypothetical protein